MVLVEGIELDDNYIVNVPYNGTSEMGGDPLTENLNIYYEVWLYVE